MLSFFFKCLLKPVVGCPFSSVSLKHSSVHLFLGVRSSYSTYGVRKLAMIARQYSLVQNPTVVRVSTYIIRLSRLCDSEVCKFFHKYCVTNILLRCFIVPVHCYRKATKTGSTGPTTRLVHDCA